MRYNLIKAIDGSSTVYKSGKESLRLVKAEPYMHRKSSSSQTAERFSKQFRMVRVKHIEK